MSGSDDRHAEYVNVPLLWAYAARIHLLLTDNLGLQTVGPQAAPLVDARV